MSDETRSDLAQQVGALAKQVADLKAYADYLELRLGWRPIEGAPKDGTCVLVWDTGVIARAMHGSPPPEGTHVIAWWGEPWCDDNNWWSNIGPVENPTHYAFLPQPPETDE